MGTRERKREKIVERGREKERKKRRRENESAIEFTEDEGEAAWGTEGEEE